MTTPTATRQPTSFQLETKIRVIIKELLEATANKLADFNQRIDGYQKYYFGFGDRVMRLQADTRSSKNEIDAIKGLLELQNQKIELLEQRSSERNEKSANMFDELSMSFNNAQQLIRNIENANYKIQTDSTKTKNRFLELSRSLQDYRTEASERVSKFVEDNVRINVEVKSMFEKISSEVFSVNLSVDQMGKTFDVYVREFANQGRINREAEERSVEVERILAQKVSRKDLSNNTYEMKEWVKGRMDEIQRQTTGRVDNALKNHQMLKKYDKQIEDLTDRSKQMQNQLHRVTKNLVGRASDNERKIDLKVEQVSQEITKEMTHITKQLTKKLQQSRGELRTSKVETTNQLILFKTELQTKMQNQTTQLKESKDKEKAAVSEQMMRVLEKNRAMQREELIDKINAVQRDLKERITDVETKIEENKIQQVRIKSSRKSSMSGAVSGRAASVFRAGDYGQGGEAEGATISHEFIHRLEDLEQKSDRNIMRIEYLQRAVSSQKQQRLLFNQKNDQTIATIKSEIKVMQVRCNTLLQQHKILVDRLVKQFQLLRKAVQQKLEAITFTVTRIRSDIINRNELQTKTIRQLGKKQQSERLKIYGVLKILPAIGECINLLMSLTFDVEMENSRLFFNSLVNPNPERFTTLSEGILYEFKEKRKQGTIYYRHREVKKADIVKAHFYAFIEMWDSLLQNQFKEKFDLFPKGFYKGFIERKLTLIRQAQNTQIAQLESSQKNTNTSLTVPSTNKPGSKPDILEALLNDNGKSGSTSKRRMSITQKRLNTSFVPTSAESPPVRKSNFMEV